jgi:hypothetical protein
MEAIANALNKIYTALFTSSQSNISGFQIPAFDYVIYGYTGVDLTTMTFKINGATGTTVAVLTYTYAASIIQTITKS